MIETKRLLKILNFSNIEELWDFHTRQMAEFGFDRIMYGYTRYRTATSLGDPNDFVLLTNHDTSYTDVFIGEGLYFHAPMVRWSLENDGACSWSVMAQMMQTGTLSERKVFDFNRSMGVVAGYSISFKSISPRTKGAIALTAREGMSQQEADEVWKEHGEDIIALNNVVHLRILTLPYDAPGRALTRRQREVLVWVGDGKTIQDIAVLLELTPATIEKHLRLAREALSVETTAQAVLKAAFQNQMFVLDA
ncbi:Autoinducer binding domain protein [Roseovarius albus]|uniref:Autoinducer binding domain protein n=1 Tax=Roseovarius albus TaxID=1247867 RepID=A0A1X6YZV2_9RHOB|nr:LuxR family transcriptional regulator [Roseovarius albus]SLN36635.1 Autoinducer binding domain protein [Roseovarius albus]